MSAAVSSSVLGAVRRRRLRRFGVPFVFGAGVVGLALVAGVLAPLPSAAAAGPGLPAPGTSTLVATNPSGGSPADGDASEVSLSADGRYAAFTSKATNLTSVPTGGVPQVYVKDMVTGTTQLVSMARIGGGAGDGPSGTPSISADGRYVAYITKATNLDFDARNGFWQVLVRDMNAGGVSRLVSKAGIFASGGNGDSLHPSMSANGEKIAFQSDAVNLIPGTTLSEVQVYVADVRPGTHDPIAVASLQDASRTSTPAEADEGATWPSISADGSVVVFASAAQNLASTPPGIGYDQVYAHWMGSGRTALVSAEADGTAGDAQSTQPAISADGAYIAYVSLASNLDDSVKNDYLQVLVQNVDGATPTRRISSSSAGDPANRHALTPSISADGSIVAFRTDATNLTSAKTPGQQIFVFDMTHPRMRMESTVAGDPSTGSGPVGAPSPQTGSYRPALAGNGAYLGFDSFDPSLATPPGAPGHTSAYLRAIQSDAPVAERVGGADRFVVSAAVSAKSFGENVPVAYVASGTGFPDALSASAAAGKQGGPVLLVTKDSVPEAIATELGRLKPQKIVVMGGTTTISDAVQTELKRYSTNVTRFDGADRYVVSAKVSEKTFPSNVPVAYLASGEGFPDALSGSAAAGHHGGPVLLTAKGALPEAVKTELLRLHPGQVIVLGGVNTISDDVVRALRDIGLTAVRTGGADRFVLSATVSADAFPGGAETVYVASGAVFPDALSGSAAAIADKGPVLLVNKDEIPGAIDTELQRLDPSRIVVLGGVNTVSDTVLTKLSEYITG